MIRKKGNIIKRRGGERMREEGRESESIQREQHYVLIKHVIFNSGILSSGGHIWMNKTRYRALFLLCFSSCWVVQKSRSGIAIMSYLVGYKWGARLHSFICSVLWVVLLASNCDFKYAALQLTEPVHDWQHSHSIAIIFYWTCVWLCMKDSKYF